MPTFTATVGFRWYSKCSPLPLISYFSVAEEADERTQSVIHLVQAASMTRVESELEPVAPEAERASPDSVTASLDALPDDALRAIFCRVRDSSTTINEALSLFSVTSRLRAAAAGVVDELSLSSSASVVDGVDILRLPYTRAGPYDLYYRGEASLLAPYGWAKVLAGLRVLRIGHLSWGGAARLLK